MADTEVAVLRQEVARLRGEVAEARELAEIGTRSGIVSLSALVAILDSIDHLRHGRSQAAALRVQTAREQVMRSIDELAKYASQEASR